MSLGNNTINLHTKAREQPQQAAGANCACPSNTQAAFPRNDTAPTPAVCLPFQATPHLTPSHASPKRISVAAASPYCALRTRHAMAWRNTSLACTFMGEEKRGGLQVVSYTQPYYMQSQHLFCHL